MLEGDVKWSARTSAFSFLAFPNKCLFSAAPRPHTPSECVSVCVCVLACGSTGSYAKCQQEDGKVSADRHWSREGLVVLKQGEKVVVAVGGEVGGVEVRQ